MVIDTSALIAILLDEAEGESFIAAIADDSRRLVSAATYVEASIVLSTRKGKTALALLDAFLRRLHFEIRDVTAEQAEIAREAYLRYGRGHHRARLNFGDCFSYALAKIEREPLLFKGDDFAHTDISRA